MVEAARKIEHYENAQPPAKPKNKNSVWIGANWSKDKKTGEDFLAIDNHKNNAGRLR